MKPIGRGPALISWRDVQKIRGYKETKCRAEIVIMRKKYNTQYLNRYHLADHYGMTIQQVEYFLLDEKDWAKLMEDFFPRTNKTPA